MTSKCLTLAVALLAACAEQPQPQSQEEARAPAEPGPAALTSADSAAALERGGAVATAVAQGLAQRLQARLKEAGAVGAVDFCSRTALALTDSLLADQPAGVAVRRTSSRIRNPRNTPDALEQAALAWFDSVRTATGTLPPAYVQAASADEVRFYRPLMIAAFCTECHGNAEQIDPGVRQILAERYPADAATGYQTGDMRGVIRVSLPRASR